MSDRYRALFQPGKIGQIQLKNRIVMAPMGTYLANRDGTAPERLTKYYEERARGGAGLIIVEIAAVDHPRGRAMTRQLGLSDEKFIPGLSALAESLHRHGAKAAVQLHHGGRISSPLLSGGHEAVAPSTLPLIPRELGSARELGVSEIEDLADCYARAALRARQAGFDGVEVHAGHGYLIAQFLSRSTNHRQDRYGGSLENRVRFLLKIIAAIRALAGADFPLWCRLDGREFAIEDGITPEEALEVARLAESGGAAALHVSAYGGSENVHFTDAPLVNEPGLLLPFASRIRGQAGVPVIAVGRFTPHAAEQALRRREADFIAFGRPLIADPDLPNKLAAGNEAIRPCIYCYNCVHQIFTRNYLSCSVNASAGRESELPAPIPAHTKTVLVVGGGPAGMEAARVAALSGHRVTLCEKEKRLGGSLLPAALVRRENEDLIRYLTGQLRDLKVQVRLKEKVTPEFVAAAKPDVVIVASGGARRAKPLPGQGAGRVIEGDDLKRWLAAGPSISRWLSRLWMPLGKRVAVLGGGTVACELAVFLAERRRRVLLLESGEALAPEMALPAKWLLLDRLERAGAEVMTKVELKEIDRGKLTVLDAQGRSRVVRAESVVDARGIDPDPALADAIKGTVPEVYALGDCSKLSLIKDSIAEANRVASAL